MFNVQCFKKKKKLFHRWTTEILWFWNLTVNFGYFIYFIRKKSVSKLSAMISAEFRTIRRSPFRIGRNFILFYFFIRKLFSFFFAPFSVRIEEKKTSRIMVIRSSVEFTSEGGLGKYTVVAVSNSNVHVVTDGPSHPPL